MRKKILFAIIAVLFFAGAKKSFAATVISSDITAPAVWTKEGSPYLINTTVNTLAPLTIEYGVVVKFAYIHVQEVVTAKLLVKNEFNLF